MRSMLGLCLIGVGVLILPRATVTADPTPQEVVQEAEAAFRSAMGAWAYEEYWRLWDMGTSASRAALSREQFTDRMRSGNTRSAAGKQVEAVEVTSNFPDAALVYARVGLEDKRRSRSESTERPFLLKLEEEGGE